MKYNSVSSKKLIISKYITKNKYTKPTIISLAKIALKHSLFRKLNLAFQNIDLRNTQNIRLKLDKKYKSISVDIIINWWCHI